MKTIKYTLTALAAVATLTVAADDAEAGNLVERCGQDQLSASQAPGRNEWALTHGYIDGNTYATANLLGWYVVFNKGSYKYGVPGDMVNPKIWVSGGSPDVSQGNDLALVGLCVPGCYTPEQEIMTEQGAFPIEAAYKREVESVMALTMGASMGDIEFAPQSIQSFVAGETAETVYVLEGDGGQRLEVTAEHPMVLSNGKIVEAWTLEPGDEVLGSNGRPIVLEEIGTFMFEGVVWNVRPESENKQENILSAQGFLTGSHRFQYEWAEDTNKFLRRDNMKLPLRR